MISLLIGLVVLCVVAYLVFLIIGWMGLPEPWNKIITVIVALIFLLVLLQNLGFMGAGGGYWGRY